MSFDLVPGNVIPFDPLGFRPFGKIARLTRQMVITEKLDGTNAQVMITRVGDGEVPEVGSVPDEAHIVILKGGGTYLLFSGSRSRWIKPGKATDNHGFAAWVSDHAAELVRGLGEGRHFGEWWGCGINRGYGLTEKKFSLFNTSRWVPHEFREAEWTLRDGQEFAPACCGVVPIISAGPFCTQEVEEALDSLAGNGSFAADGYDRPEGVVIFHVASGHYFKKTLESDDAPKSIANAGIDAGPFLPDRFAQSSPEKLAA